MNQPETLRLQTDGLTLARWASLIVCAAVFATCWPLLTYSMALATFGAAHVLWELRYVGVRFGARLGLRLGLSIGVGLGAIAALRVGLNLGWLGPEALTGELALVCLLLILTLPRLLHHSWRLAGVGALAPIALAVGTTVSPTHTLLVLAVAHNLTPIGFVAEALRGEDRRRLLSGAALVFVVLPALIATGAPAKLAHAIGLYSPEQSILPTGPLAHHLGAYLPAAWHDQPWAAHAFSAVVFGQCMHYLAVIDVLPGLMGENPQRGRWPHPALGVLALLACAGLGVAFTQDFSATRLWYGPLAALHAWVELPVLLLSLLLLSAHESVHQPAAEAEGLR